jgi:hypothetical protein
LIQSLACGGAPGAKAGVQPGVNPMRCVFATAQSAPAIVPRLLVRMLSVHGTDNPSRLETTMRQQTQRPVSMPVPGRPLTAVSRQVHDCAVFV